MSESEKIALCQNLINDVNVSEAEISAYLNIASDRIMQAAYPFGTTLTELPDKYSNIQCELAVRMIARRGGEGEIAHSENGVSRTYGNVDDVDILSRIVPCVGVI